MVTDPSPKILQNPLKCESPHFKLTRRRLRASPTQSRPSPSVSDAKQPYGRVRATCFAAAHSTRSRSPVYLCTHLHVFYISLCKYIQVYMYTPTCIYTHAGCAHTRTQTHTHTHARTHIHTHTHMHTRARTNTHTQTHTHTHTRTHTHSNTHRRNYTHTPTHTHTHTHIHTHTVVHAAEAICKHIPTTHKHNHIHTNTHNM